MAGAGQRSSGQGEKSGRGLTDPTTIHHGEGPRDSAAPSADGFPRHSQYTGIPAATRRVPMPDSHVFSASMFRTNAAAVNTNRTGTTGYPGTRYGRGSSGLVLRRMMTASAVRA